MLVKYNANQKLFEITTIDSTIQKNVSGKDGKIV